MRRWVLLGVLVLVAPAPVRAAEPILLCQHAPISGAAPIPHHPSRFGQFYFDYVNAELGGVNGRPVTLRTINDFYNPAGARNAVEQCARDNTVLYVGPLGVDQIVSVAKWAERKHVPYLHGSVSRTQLGTLAWSAFRSPPTEDAQIVLASSIAANAEDLGRTASLLIGMVRIDSPYSQAAHDAFVDELAVHDLSLERDMVTQKDETQFANMWREMELARVNVLNADVPSNIFVKMMRQRPPTYEPTILSGSSDIGYNNVALSAATQHVFVLHDPGPAYDTADTSSPWAAEAARFREIFARYSPEQDPPPDDVDWTFYLYAKQLHRLLLSLDGNYSPERFMEAFSTYSETPAEAFPTCALDFSTDPRVGQHRWHVFGNEQNGWLERQFCVPVSASGPMDLSDPTIACDDAVLVTGSLRCALTDATSGVGHWETTSALRGTVTSGDGACATAVQAEVELPPGPERVSVTASDCSGNKTTSAVVVVSLPG